LQLLGDYFIRDEHGEEYKVISTNVVGYRVEDTDGNIKTISYENAGVPYRKTE